MSVLSSSEMSASTIIQYHIRLRATLLKQYFATSFSEALTFLLPIHLVSYSLLASFSFLGITQGGLLLAADESCKRYTDVIVAAYEEAVQMATLTVARLASSTDTDFENVYKAIFKTDKSDATSLKGVSGMSLLWCPIFPLYLSRRGSS